MSEKEETQKLFYTIGEVSEMFELNASTLRFWEKEFDFLKPSKNKKGNRTFTQKDIDNIAKIVELVKQKGFTIQGAKEQLKGGSSSASSKTSGNNAEVIAKLQDIKDKLIDLGDQL
ncbi:MAG: MerR family transcriptional regulator [Bacteroidetes bacterium]|jgi:DNA-binding transcriptional MerR regulator|nr:MerR family transcriptional regulator [Bacteroidota bacterium]